MCLEATAVDLGGGCGVPAPPVFTADAPGRGTMATIRVTSVQAPHSILQVYASVGSPAPFPFPGTPCTIHVDYANLATNLFVVFETMTDAQGTFQVSIPIPDIQELDGISITMQARVYDVGGLLCGGHLSNGYRLTFGCPPSHPGGSGSSGSSGSSGASGSGGTSGSSGGGSAGSSGSSGSSS